jgi:hypothetical protein
MNAQPIQTGPGDSYDWRRDELIARDERIDAIAARIDADADRVIDLFLDEAIHLQRDGKGNGHIEMIAAAVAAMNAWPAIEKLGNQPLTLDEQKTLPALFRAIRPLIDERAVMVRQAAELEIGL